MNIIQGHERLFIFVIFNTFILALLLIDLGVFFRPKEHILPFKEAVIRTIIMVFISIAFAILIYFIYSGNAGHETGKSKSLEFIAGYLLEYSLSIDNLFVFIMIFNKFKIAPSFQPEILKWGIIGAIVLRGIMILLGSTLIQKFEWLLYFFGILLLYTAYNMFFHDKEQEFNPEDNYFIKIIKKIIPFTSHHHHDKFFIRENKRILATPLFLTLAIIEISDVMFALDSIPAIFAITTDPLIVYTSNIFAIVGLRSLYFMINGIMDMFVHLQKGVSLVLFFIGLKMILPFFSELFNLHKLQISIEISLVVIVSILATAIIFSLPEYHKNKNSQ